MTCAAQIEYQYKVTRQNSQASEEATLYCESKMLHRKFRLIALVGRDYSVFG